MSDESRAPAADEPVRAAVLDPAFADTARRIDQWLTLQQQLCLAPARATELLARHDGDPVRAMAAAPARGRDRSRPGPGRLSAWRGLLARLGAVVVPWPLDGYPPALRLIPDPPPVLLVRGRVEALHRVAVAVVGARAPTAYGRDIARKLGAGLARSGAVVVSGLARGVDAAAHEGALEAGGVTVAVQACGPETVYPPEHARLADRIAREGAVVTELSPGRPPLPPYFPLRNRLISGLARGVVVVEARARSGSLITARHALDQGREVMAVPGPVTAPTSVGPNGLLRDGARPVVELRDVVEAMGLDEPAAPATAPVQVPVDADPESARLFAMIGESPATPDELLAQLDWTPRELALRLLGLEIDGLVVADRDGRVRAVSRSPL